MMADPAVEPGLTAVAALDGDLADVLQRHGPPPPRTRPPGFTTLLNIVVQQQVSLASARAIWGRLEAGLGRVEPARVLDFGIEDLRAMGLSLPKARYAIALAETVASGELDLDGLAGHDDEAAIAALTRVKGIGRWTAEIYLLSALQRPDIWPAADLALMVAAQDLKGLARRPDAAEMAELAVRWRPWRTFAARLLWHHYRHARGRDTAL